MHIATTLGLDVLAHESADELAVLVDLTAPSAPPVGGEHVVRALVVVLDRSGSMHGERIEGAKTALLDLVDRLDPDDLFGLVTFDSEVDVVVPTGPLRNRTAVKRAVAGVHPRGSTDLSNGYLRGLDEARRVATPGGATVLLISDGHANEGLTDPSVLEGLAAKGYADGITTSTLGFGLGYDERIMSAIARGGSGNELFAEEADTAVKQIAGEVDGLLTQVAQAASLLIRMSPHVRRAKVLNDLSCRPVAEGILVELGSFYAAENRKLVLVFDIPGIAALGLAQVAELQFRWLDVATVSQQHVTVPVHVNVVPGDQAAGRIPDATVTAERAYLEVQSAKREASRQLSDGDVAGAMARLAFAHELATSALASAPAGSRAALGEEADALRFLREQTRAGEIARAAKFSSADARQKSALRGRRMPTGGRPFAP